MIFRNGNINDLLEFANGKKLVCYGYGDDLSFLCKTFAPYGLLERIDYITDGTGDSGAVSVNGTEKPLVRIGRLLDLGVETVLLIAEIRGLNDLRTCSQ